MLDWLLGKRKHKQELPCYSGLLSSPTRGLPAELQEQEASEFFTTRRETIANQLDESARRTPHDEPFFTELVNAKGRGVVTLDLPDDGGRCLAVFSTPIRAADYVQTILNAGLSVQYLRSSPLELTQMLHDLAQARVQTFTLDRCPRCNMFSAIGSGSIKTADDLLNIWAIFKATELARANLYFEYAVELSLRGQLEDARDVALETVGHVTMEDPRLHLLLGQLGVGLRDRKLVGEAKAFLGFLKLEKWERKLDSVVTTGLPDFADPDWR
jgi:hypothetical protein